MSETASERLRAAAAVLDDLREGVHGVYWSKAARWTQRDAKMTTAWCDFVMVMSPELARRLSALLRSAAARLDDDPERPCRIDSDALAIADLVASLSGRVSA